MKTKFYLISGIILLILFRNVNAQNIELVVLKNSIKIGNNLGELGKGLQFQKAGPMLYTPDDIEIDNKNNFYICDRFSKTIYKYDSLLNLIYEKRIDDESFKGILIQVDDKKIPLELRYYVDLETDLLGNLYALMGYMGYYYRMIKYDTEGNLIDSFKLEIEPKNLRVYSTFISKDKILIATGLSNIFSEDEEFRKQKTFVYDLDGKFLGRCNTYFEDFYGNIYNTNTLIKGKFLVEQYLPSSDEKIKPTSELTLSNNLYFEKPENSSGELMAIDTSNNIYLIFESPFSLKIFNFNNNKVIEIIRNEGLQKFLEKKYRIQIPNSRQFLLSPTGEIYTYGFKTINNNENLWKEYNYNELELKFIKIKILEK